MTTQETESFILLDCEHCGGSGEYEANHDGADETYECGICKGTGKEKISKGQVEKFIEERNTAQNLNSELLEALKHALKNAVWSGETYLNFQSLIAKCEGRASV